jgi:hypothetical protein
MKHLALLSEHANPLAVHGGAGGQNVSASELCQQPL